MIQKISVMIVDDSSMYRELLRSALSDDSRVQVIAQAVNGKLAIPRVKHYKPDFIILDQEMPEMTGLETLREIRRLAPESRVIMFCSVSKEGADIALKALQEGAVDFVTKPGPDNDKSFGQYVRETIIERIVQLGQDAKRVSTPEPVKRKPSAIASSFRLCGIGISTGGPVALRQLFGALSPRIKGSILIVQHMPPVFTKQFAESLDRIGTLRVKEAEDGDLVAPATAYIAPGGKQTRVVQAGPTFKLQVSDDPPLYNCRPSVNVLFSSMAALPAVRDTMAVIMTGMGNDGYEGMRSLRKNGAMLLAQSEKSCLIFGMPSQPVEEGLVDDVGDIDHISRQINLMMGAG
ncbi:MAG: chemotaxis-specific protein-glutamate methyltransferase CheB [Leptospirales bacterium]|nr:chemotaxis-specific protein-glutamate methyltransferase CheB [Leptospirales bacterium]